MSSDREPDEPTPTSDARCSGCNGPLPADAILGQVCPKCEIKEDQRNDD
jgi:hypothetical protein